MSEAIPAHLAGFRPGSLVAGYRLEAHVGTGGMAVVFRARDERLGRLVALKILAPALAADRAFRRRFIAESRAAAVVDDPHVIPVYEAGEADSVLFIAMRFVRGGDLRGVLDREGALPPRRTAEFISPVASALDAAHGAGLVHRDVKPANILVDTSAGRPDHVYLSDFGVSKGAISSGSLTGTGQFLGTPDYSAPEQIQGRAVDGRTDQYALACVAYQLLTGAAPFVRDQGMAVLLAHLSEPPPSLGSRLPNLSDAADQVLARALAKAPERRYRSCRDFAEALREALGLVPYHHGSAFAYGQVQPEFASPLSGFPWPTTSGIGRGAVPADPVEAATIDSVPARSPVVADMPAGRTHSGARPETIPPVAAAEEGSIPATNADERVSMTDTDRPARYDRRSGSAAQPARCPPRSTLWIRRHRLVAIGLTVAVLAAAIVVPSVLASYRSPVTSPGSVSSLRDNRGGMPSSVAFSPSGATLAVGGQNGSTDLWNTSTRTLAATLTDPGSVGISSVTFSPDGATLAATDGNGSIYLWNTATRTLAATLTDPGGCGIASVAFSPNGATLATTAAAADCYGSIYLWNTATRKLAATLTDPGGYVGTASVAFSPNGATLAAADDDGSVYLWNTATRTLAATLTDPGGYGTVSFAVSPNGATLAAADGNGSVYLWNTATKKLAATLTDPYITVLAWVAFSPSGKTLAAAKGNGSVYLWNTATKKLTATLTDPGSAGVTSIAFSPNGATLATADDNGSTYLWHIS